MSANREVVCRALELYEQGLIDEWVQAFAPDAEVPTLTLLGTESVYRGRDGIRRWATELRSAGTVVRSYADEFIDDDDTHLVVAGRVVVDEGDGRGFGSVAGWIYMIEDGLITRVEVYPHPTLAMQAAGLHVHAGR